MFKKRDQQLLAEAYASVLENIDKTSDSYQTSFGNEDNLRRLAVFADEQVAQAIEHSPLGKKYNKVVQGFKGLAQSGIRSLSHEEGIIDGLVQIAQDPESDDGSPYSVKSKIEGFINKIYPEYSSKLSASGIKGTLGGAGIQYR